MNGNKVWQLPVVQGNLEKYAHENLLFPITVTPQNCDYMKLSYSWPGFTVIRGVVPLMTEVIKGYEMVSIPDIYLNRTK